MTSYDGLEITTGRGRISTDNGSLTDALINNYPVFLEKTPLPSPILKVASDDAADCLMNLAGLNRPYLQEVLRFVGGTSQHVSIIGISSHVSIPWQSSEIVYDDDQPHEVPVSTSPEAARRSSAHKELVTSVCSLAKKVARESGLSLLKVDVLEEWSHEYEEHDGIVIEAYISATREEREEYWDAVCERLDDIQASVPEEGRRFINENISFSVRKA